MGEKGRSCRDQKNSIITSQKNYKVNHYFKLHTMSFRYKFHKFERYLFAPKNQCHFLYSIAPLLEVLFPLLLIFPIFLHHEKIKPPIIFCSIQYCLSLHSSMILFIQVIWLYFNNCSFSTGSPTHVSVSQCFVFDPLFTYFLCNISSTAVSSINFYRLMNPKYLTLNHLSQASQSSVQLQ